MPRHASARVSNIHVQEIGDELVVFDEITQRSHALDAMTTAVWRAADGSRDEAAIAQLTGLHVEQVAVALAGLAEAELVNLPEGLSRRGLLAKGALVGGAALASPAILSLIAPSLASAASTTGGGGGGGGNVVFTETWEGNAPSGQFDSYSAGQSFGQWTVDSGSVDVVQAGFYPLEQNPSTVLDTAGSSPGKVSTTGFTATAGSYTVSFEVVQNAVGDPADTVQVGLGNASANVVPTATTFSDPTRFKSVTLTVTTSGPLSFACIGTGGPNAYGGPIIDNITVTQN